MSREIDVHQSLEGMTVIDLTQVVSGAVASMLMAEAGAEVIKIEPPGGEAYRRAGHVIENEAGQTNLNIMRWSRRKRSVVLDLKSDEGRDLLSRLLAGADVLVENFRPGVLARLGFPPERLREINPDLIYTTVSGFGHDDVVGSAMTNIPAYAIVTEAMAGLMHLARDPQGEPVWLGFAMADIFAGTLAFSGTLMALLERERAEAPSHRVDVAMHDGAVMMNDLAIAAHSVLGEDIGGRQYSLQAPWGPFPTADGHVAIAVLTEAQWQTLCSVIERPDLAVDERLQNGRGRSAFHQQIVGPAVAAWAAARTKAEVTALLSEAGVPTAPVQDADDVRAHEQTRLREMLIEVDDPVAGTVELVGNPIKLDRGSEETTRPRISRTGEHTFEVLAQHLGLTTEELDHLAETGAIGTPPS